MDTLHEPAAAETPGAGARAGLKDLCRVFRPAAHYPRAAVELALVALSVALGLAFLPPLDVAASASQMAISYIVVDQSANVPTYVLDQPADQGSPQNQVTIGMDVPSTGPKVHWQLLIAYAKADRLSPQYTSSGVRYGSVRSSDRSTKLMEFTGTMKPGSLSYTEFQDGYLENQLTDLQSPKDISTVTFTVRGPVHSDDTTGSTLSISEPAIADFIAPPNSSSHVNGQTPTDFKTEVLFDAGSFELQGSGPTVTGPPGHLMWDWISQGAAEEHSAIGTDNAQVQTDQNHLFLAAVFFGVSAAAAAALALELVGAFQEHHKERRRRKGPDLSGRPLLS